MGKIPELMDCNPGFAPAEYNCVVYPEVTEAVTAGGILLPDRKRETDEISAMKGRLVAASPLAFNYDAWPEGASKPQVGDVVLYAKYGGVLIEGADGKECRVLKDKDIMGVFN